MLPMTIRLAWLAANRSEVLLLIQPFSYCSHPVISSSKAYSIKSHLRSSRKRFRTTLGFMTGAVCYDDCHHCTLRPTLLGMAPG